MTASQIVDIIAVGMVLYGLYWWIMVLRWLLRAPCRSCGSRSRIQLADTGVYFCQHCSVLVTPMELHR